MNRLSKLRFSASLAWGALLLITALGVLAGCQGEVKQVKSRPKKIEKIDVGRIKIKDPSTKKLIVTELWGEVPANQVAIILDGDKGRKDADKLAKRLGGKVVGEIEFINMFQIETTGADHDHLRELVFGAQKLPGVEIAMPNIPVVPQEIIKGTPHNPFKDDVYGVGQNSRHYDIIGTKNAWDIIRGSDVELNDVHVGVADAPLNSGSDELNITTDGQGRKDKPRIQAVRKEDQTDQPARNDRGQIESGGFTHGTMVTHVIAADAENGGVIGVAGILKDKLKVTARNVYDAQGPRGPVPIDPNDPTQIITADGKAYSNKTIAHILAQVKSGAKIINCSFGPDEPDANYKPVAESYKRLLQKLNREYPDVLIVAAAGNETGVLTEDNYFPAGYKLPNLITVGAIDNDGNMADFSNYTEGDGEVTLAAPGVEMVLGVGPDGMPIRASGTSFSAPQVAAAAALIKSINPSLTAAQIKKILAETASPGVPGKDKSILAPERLGAGILSVDDAVLKTINDMRQEKGLAPLKKDFLLALGEVDMWADGEDGEYKIIAVLKSVKKNGTDATIELRGEGSITGKSTRRLPVPGRAEWEASVRKGKTASVKVARQDTGAWSTVDLTAGHAIKSIEPVTGGPQTKITIKGTGFKKAQGGGSVMIGNTMMPIDSWSDTEIVVTVPVNAETGDITVVIDGENSNGVEFEVDKSVKWRRVHVKFFGTHAFSNPNWQSAEITVFNYESGEHPLVWSGKKFSVSYAEDLTDGDAPETLVVTISGELAKDGKSIKSITVKRRSFGVNAQKEPWESVRSFAVVDIPREFDRSEFRVRGPEVKNHISGVVDYFKTDGRTVNDYAYTSTNWGGQFAPEIDINFYP